MRVFVQSGLSALEVFTENGFLFQLASIELAPDPDYLETAQMSIKNIKYFIKYFSIEAQNRSGLECKLLSISSLRPVGRDLGLVILWLPCRLGSINGKRMGHY